MIYVALALAFASGYVACLWHYDPERLKGWVAAAREAGSSAAAKVRAWRESRRAR